MHPRMPDHGTNELRGLRNPRVNVKMWDWVRNLPTAIATSPHLTQPSHNHPAHSYSYLESPIGACLPFSSFEGHRMRRKWRKKKRSGRGRWKGWWMLRWMPYRIERTDWVAKRDMVSKWCLETFQVVSRWSGMLRKEERAKRKWVEVGSALRTQNKRPIERP